MKRSGIWFVKREFQKRIALVLLLLLAALLCMPSAYAEDREAQDLTSQMQFEKSGGRNAARDRLYDKSLNETVQFWPRETIRLTWEKAANKAAYLCIQWGAIPYKVTLRQIGANGEILADQYAAEGEREKARIQLDIARRVASAFENDFPTRWTRSPYDPAQIEEISRRIDVMTPDKG